MINKQRLEEIAESVKGTGKVIEVQVPSKKEAERTLEYLNDRGFEVRTIKADRSRVYRGYVNTAYIMHIIEVI